MRPLCDLALDVAFNSILVDWNWEGSLCLLCVCYCTLNVSIVLVEDAKLRVNIYCETKVKMAAYHNVIQESFEIYRSSRLDEKAAFTDICYILLNCSERLHCFFLSFYLFATNRFSEEEVCDTNCCYKISTTCFLAAILEVCFHFCRLDSSMRTELCSTKKWIKCDV